MALIHCDFRSEVLNLASSFYVVLPHDTSGPHPVLYLLHGLSDDHTIWQRRTSIERYVADLGLAVVMPGVNRSFYTNMASGPRYWDYISEEIPAACRRLFRISDRREDTFVAGLSMGGYGAYKLALSLPDRYSAAASLSGALDMAHREDKDADSDPEWKREMEGIFGPLERMAGSTSDLLYLAERVASAAGPPPALYACCGTDDFLLQSNRAFRDRAESLGLSLEYEETPGADHEWGYWDRMIQKVLAWLPLASNRTE